MKVVGRAEPFHSTVAPDRNAEPFTVSVKSPPPAAVSIGLRFVMSGTGGLIVKLTVFDVTPPPEMVTAAVPCEAIRFAPTVAVICVGLTNVVGKAEPFQSTMAPKKSPVPFTVSVKAFPPAAAVEGLRVATAGTGWLIGKLTTFDGPAPGLTAVTFALPAVVILPAGTEAMSCVALTTVVERAEPFNCTTAPERKPVPFTVNVKVAPPAVAELGLRLAIVAAGT